MNVRAAIYARQSAPEEQGIEQQIADCTEEAKRRGWTLVTGPYPDDAVSGSTERDDTTAWKQMLRDYDDGLFDALIVNDTDRMTRRLEDVLEVRGKKRNMRIIVVRGNIDTADDDYMLKQMVLLAEEEVKRKARRARRYAHTRRQEGHPTPGRAPHGYDWVRAVDRDEKRTRYAVNAHEAEDVRFIFREFLEASDKDRSLKQITRELNTAGRRTKSGSKWHSSTVRRVLLNPVYAAKLPPAQPTGKFRFENIELEACAPGAWEPIIEFERVAAARGMLIGVKPNHSGTARRWLLGGIAVCGVCRGSVRSAAGETKPTPRRDGSGSAPSKRYHAYRCREHGHFQRNGDIIDDYVAEVCIARLSRDDANKLLVPPQEELDLGALQTRRMDLDSRYETIFMEMAEVGRPEAGRKALRKLEANIAEVDSLIARAMRRDPLAEVVHSEDVRAWWESATLDRRITVVETLMTVVIHKVGYGKKVRNLTEAAATVSIEWKQAEEA
ncbi:recombinase family protein [Nesterenkonia sp. NBAIMH1]|uniref:recombinase family protein n=1 Tax=Nesterenkonia sp. NBAIMH1 TaxID=2600320 RepID=UPI0011B475F8|nr:recombinase family protein [Nesterenkonia sp. NBAIMH1]